MRRLRVLLAAPVRGRQSHVSALILHHAAAGPLLRAEPGSGRHTDHRRSEPRQQDDNDHSELEGTLHTLNYSITEMTASRLCRLLRQQTHTLCMNPSLAGLDQIAFCVTPTHALNKAALGGARRGPEFRRPTSFLILIQLLWPSCRAYRRALASWQPSL